MSKHTPSPWSVKEGHIIGADDRQTIVCSFHGPLAHEMVLADALLIAAAPDLLVALQRLHDWAGAMCQVEYTGSHPVAVARAAIAKATNVHKTSDTEKSA